MRRALRTVFVREARDLLRDRRSLLLLFAMPLLMPLVGAIGGAFLAWQILRQTHDGLPILVVNGDQMPALVERLERSELLALVDASLDSQQALQSGELMAVLEIPPDAAALLEAEQQVSLKLTSSRSGWLPDFAVVAIRSGLDDYGDQLLGQRLSRRELDETWIEPLLLERETAAPVGVAAIPVVAGEATPSSLGSLFLPLMAASWAFSGGLNLVASMTVGEKEHHTMESLLVTPASRLGVVLGKILFSVIVSAITIGLWSLDSLAYTLLLAAMPSGFDQFGSSVGTQLGDAGIVLVWLILLMLPLMTMTNGLVAAVCTFARDYREANLLLALIQLLLPLVALGAAFAVGSPPAKAIYALPMLGVFVIIRDLFGAGAAPGSLILAWVAAAIYAVGAVLLASYVFSREWALMRGV